MPPPPSWHARKLRACHASQAHPVPQENIDLQSTILSRFDLIFIVKDERNRERDRQIATHVVRVHANAGAVDEMSHEQKEQETFLRRYIQFAKSRIHTRLSPEAARVLGAR